MFTGTHHWSIKNVNNSFCRYNYLLQFIMIHTYTHSLYLQTILPHWNALRVLLNRFYTAQWTSKLIRMICNHSAGEPTLPPLWWSWRGHCFWLTSDLLYISDTVLSCFLVLITISTKCMQIMTMCVNACSISVAVLVTVQVDSHAFQHRAIASWT